jgi:hypothetical protein
MEGIMQYKHCKSILSFLTILLIISTGNFYLIFSQNLILNPGCEDSLINGEIPDWVEVIGTSWTQRINANPPTYEGDYMFFPGAVAYAELQQDVDVTNMALSIDNSNVTFNFEGYLRAYNQSPPDLSRIILEFIDSLKTTKLDSFDSGNYSNTNEWVQITDTTLAPIGTRFIRIRLISTRRAGTNNDGYYDGLSLETQITGMSDEMENRIPNKPTLLQNYPNTFNPITSFEFSIPKSEFVTLKIYNLLGREVATLVSEKLTQGTYNYPWDASAFSSGVYYCKIEADNYIQTKKLLLIK